MLDSRRPKPNNLFFGLQTEDNWVWIDGTLFNGSLWMPGYPAGYHGIQSCAVMTAGSSKIKDVDCRLTKYILCQKQSGGCPSALTLFVLVLTAYFTAMLTQVLSGLHTSN